MYNVKLKKKSKYIPLILLFYVAAKIGSVKIISYSIKKLVDKNAFIIINVDN
ncbi:hypothetical protein IGJ62_001834 [Enterococcus pernyi]